MKLKMSLIIDYPIPDEVYDEVTSAEDWKDNVAHLKQVLLESLAFDEEATVKITKFIFEK